MSKKLSWSTWGSEVLKELNLFKEEHDQLRIKLKKTVEVLQKIAKVRDPYKNPCVLIAEDFLKHMDGGEGE